MGSLRGHRDGGDKDCTEKAEGNRGLSCVGYHQPGQHMAFSMLSVLTHPSDKVSSLSMWKSPGDQDCLAAGQIWEGGQSTRGTLL